MIREAHIRVEKDIQNNVKKYSDRFDFDTDKNESTKPDKTVKKSKFKLADKLKQTVEKAFKNHEEDITSGRFKELSLFKNSTNQLRDNAFEHECQVAFFRLLELKKTIEDACPALNKITMNVIRNSQGIRRALIERNIEIFESLDDPPRSFMPEMDNRSARDNML